MNETVREQLREQFNQRFERWEIALPPEALESDQASFLRHQGWNIWVRAGEEDGRQYLDYYASHRMSGDSHIRLFADGERESLPTIQTFYVLPKDGDPEKKHQARDELYAHNREVQRLLEEKGFGSTDHADVITRANRFLLTNPDA